MRRAGLALALLVGAAGCRARSLGTFPDAPVVLVSIDTLRADRLPLYGYGAGSTPALDALSREGIVFEDVYSHCPLTLPAHASLFTGLLPPRHGVRDNLGFVLDAKNETLASRFKTARFQTGAAVSAYVLRMQTGIARGFDFYEDHVELSGGSEALASAQRDGAAAVEALASWIEGQGGGRFFAFLHLYEPHSPYSPPAAYTGFAQPYDGEVAYADALVGRFLERLRARGLYDRAVVAVTSDHGEGLGDHREDEHGIFLYREAVHVPLILRLPGGLRGGLRVSGTAAQVDVAATLLDLAGLPAQGLDGVSLRPAIDQGRTDSRPVYSETLFPRYHFGWSELYGVTEGRYRYIRAPRPELFDVVSDRGETRNLAPARASTISAMDAWLRRAVDIGHVAAPGEVSQETREKLSALGYVGSGSGPVAGQRPDPKDKIGSYQDLRRAMALRRELKDEAAVALFRKVLEDNPGMVDAWEVLGDTLARMGRPGEGIAALDRALTLEPGRVATHMTLARIHAAAGRRERAMKHAEIAAASDPAETYETLARLMLDVRQPVVAAELARRSLRADSERAMSHFVLGVVARGGGRYEEALGHFQRAEGARRARQRDHIPNLQAYIGDALARLGRGEEAERAFLAEIEAAPATREGRVGLAMLYRAWGRDAEARAVLAGLLSAQPHPDAGAYWTVVSTFSILGDRDSARELARRARSLFPSDPRFRGP